MKKITFILIALFTCSLSYGQIRVVTSGDTGVGTTAPATQLHVVDDNAELRIESTTATSALGIQNPTNKWRFFLNTVGAMNIRDVTNNTQVFRFDAGAPSASFRMTSNGFVGLANTAPTERLHVNGNVFSTGSYLPSDRKLKDNVTSFNYGLKEVLELNPIEYRYNGIAGLDRDNVHVGIMAQDLQEVAPSLVEPWEYAHYDSDTDELLEQDSYLKINDTAIKYMLINSIKEQQEIIQNQEERLIALEERIEQLVSTNTTLTNGIEVELNSTDSYKGAFISQNQPNPFGSNTSINYSIPQGTTNASIQFYDINGKIIKNVPLTELTGEINVKAANLSSGIYSYALVINGEILDTKKMVLAK